MPARTAPDFRSRLLRLAAVCALILGAGEVRASVAAAASSVEQPESGHSCPCGMSCKGKCCCAGKKARKVVSPATPSVPESPERKPGATPCLAPFGCGGDATPPATPRGVSLGEPALIALEVEPTVEPSRRLAEFDPPRPSVPAHERLDDPPEFPC